MEKGEAMGETGVRDGESRVGVAYCRVEVSYLLIVP